MANSYWELEATLESPLGRDHGFGYSTVVNGDYVVIGTGSNNGEFYSCSIVAPLVNGFIASTVFIYENLPNGWSQIQSLVAPGGNTYFGRAVGIDGDFLVVGAEATKNSVGEVYVYNLNHTVAEGRDHHEWYLNATLKSVLGNGTYFGHAVDIYNSTIAIGAKGFEPMVFNARGQRE